MDSTWSFLKSAAEELAKNAPLYLVVIIVFIIFWFMHRNSIKANEKLIEKTFEKLDNAYKDSLKLLKEAYSEIFEKRR